MSANKTTSFNQHFPGVLNWVKEEGFFKYGSRNFRNFIQSNSIPYFLYIDTKYNKYREGNLEMVSLLFLKEHVIFSVLQSTNFSGFRPTYLETCTKENCEQVWKDIHVNWMHVWEHNLHLLTQSKSTLLTAEANYRISCWVRARVLKSMWRFVQITTGKTADVTSGYLRDEICRR